MKKILTFIFSVCSILTLSTVVSGQENIDNYVAVGATNSQEQINYILSLFNLPEDHSPIFYINGEVLNEHINDGSDINTEIYSSVLVNVNEAIDGVQVKILTPENITSVSETSYQNAAITAGATNAEILIASAQQVTGEGALGGVYEIFKQSGYSLNETDIQTAENLIYIEQLLRDETNMSESEISQMITEYNLEIIYALEENATLDDDTILSLLNGILDKYNYVFSEEVRNRLFEHGVAFAASDVSKDPATKAALEEAMQKYSSLNTIYSHGDLEVKIDEIYLTDERNEFEDNNYDYVLTIKYTGTNTSDEEFPLGNDFSLYVNGQLADDYFLSDDTSVSLSSNRSGQAKTSFGFNGSTENMELELKDFRYWEEQPVIIKLDSNGTPIGSQTAEESKETEVENGLSDSTKELIDKEILITLLDAFVEKGLNVFEPSIMARDDFGAAPLVTSDAVKFGAQYAKELYIDENGNADPYNYGRLFYVENQDELSALENYYVDLAKQSALFYSHTFSKGNILLQMGGDVPDEDFADYVTVIEEIVDNE